MIPSAGVSSVLGREPRGLAARLAVAPEERALAGVVVGVFYVIGAVTLVPLSCCQADAHYHPRC